MVPAMREIDAGQYGVWRGDSMLTVMLRTRSCFDERGIHIASDVALQLDEILGLEMLFSVGHRVALGVVLM